MKKNITSFLKKNASYLIVGFCVLSVGLSVLLVAISKSNVKTVSTATEQPVYEQVLPIEDEPTVQTILFDMPVSNYSSATDSSTVIVFNSTLGRYESHSGMDFYTEEGEGVYAVYNGTVESVTNDILKGYTIVINHGNNLKTVYNSLLDGDEVFVGQYVQKGERIGEVSLSNRQEYKDGAHLHFEVLKDSVSVNPDDYFLGDNK